MIAPVKLSMEPLVKTHVHEHTGTLILNRPDKRNALSRAMLADLDQGLHDLHGMKRVRAVVITGAGSAFCSGMDLAEMRETSQQSNALEQWNEDAIAYRDLIEYMLQFPKPLIAAVNGPAVAGGAGLVLGCDIVLAADNASFGLPEPKRGLVAGLVSPLLTFRVGAGTAGYLLLTAQTIDAPTAYRLGLFHELVTPDLLWARATQVAAQVAESAPQALLLTKRMLNETIGEHLGTELTSGAAVSATARTTEAAAEGLAAFLEKRPPEWK
jgi:methylglutaconyl-CoA hydratase